MARAAGILTSRGGLASHAAVVARGWGIPAVVGASGIEVRDGDVRRRRPDPEGRRGHHDRWQHRRGLRRHRRRRDGADAGGADAARVGGRSSGSPIGDAGADGEAARRRSRRGPDRSRRHTRRLSAGARDQGLRPGRGRRRFRPVHAGRGPDDPRPARRRRAGRDGRRRLQADRVRHEPGGRAARRGAGGVGHGTAPPPRSMRSWTSTTA